MNLQLYRRLMTCLPHHALSRLIGYLSRWKGGCLTHWAIQKFIQHYQINMQEAKQSNISTYTTFNDFFTRALKTEPRPIDPNPHTICSPADAIISEIGTLHNQQLLQAKNQYYNLTRLLGNDAKMAALFKNGTFLTAYLMPKHYHRIHMPITGILKTMTHIPGRLFSVNPWSVNHIDCLFTRNERVVILFDTVIGPMILILVGAMLVGSIETVWHGQVTPPTGKHISTWQYNNVHIVLKRGEEMGRFNMGSTVIVLLSNKTTYWNQAMCPGDEISFGTVIGMHTI